MLGSNNFKYVNCPLCGRSNYAVDKKIYLEKKIVSELVRCSNCGLGFLNPQPGDLFLKQCYEFQYSDMEPANLGKIRIEREDSRAHEALERYRNYINFLHELTGGAKGLKILDYGCGMGHFLNLAREEGYLPSGLEISSGAVAFAREKHGLEVYSLGEKKLTDLEADSYDVFSLFHVIEHLPDPLDFLKKCFRLLKPGGMIIIAAPNYDSVFDRIWKIVRLIKFYLRGEQSSKSEFLRRSFEGLTEINRPLKEADEGVLLEYKLRAFHHLLYFTMRSLKKLVVQAGFGEPVFSSGYVIPGTSFAKKMFKNNIVNKTAALFGMQEELLLIARKPGENKNIGEDI